VMNEEELRGLAINKPKGMLFVFDLDNTLCKTVRKADGNWDYENAEPIIDRIEMVNRLFNQGAIIYVETARGSVSKVDWYQKTSKQISAWGLKFHKLRAGTKFPGDFFVDDKAINSEFFFGGKWE
jgi:hypothetical protein